MNVGQWIEYVAAELEAAKLHYGHGTDNPEDEATWLVLHAIGAIPDGSFEHRNRQLTRDQETQVRKTLAARIEKRTPLAYLLGSAWFAGLEFGVDPSVLVPRSPIAELILEQFIPWMNDSSNPSMLDLCTGCGCIAIAAACHMPWLEVDATDISRAALAVAQRNVHRHGVESRVRLIHSDLFDAVPHRHYNLIVTNPPYVPESALKHLPGEYRVEPEVGLLSGADGLDACLRIMLKSPSYLKSEGSLICEVGESEQRLTELLPTVPFLWLEFRHGGSGVFVLARKERIQSSTAIMNVIEERSNVG